MQAADLQLLQVTTLGRLFTTSAIKTKQLFNSKSSERKENYYSLRETETKINRLSKSSSHSCNVIMLQIPKAKSHLHPTTRTTLGAVKTNRKQWARTVSK